MRITHIALILLVGLPGLHPNDALGADSNQFPMEFIPVPAGAFTMGSATGDWDELPVHEATLTTSFELSKTAVTLEQFQQFRPGHVHSAPSGAVTSVSWHDAVAFCRWLSEREGGVYRLPTEAEWEYACRLNGGGPGDRDEPWSGEDKLGLSGMCDDVLEWCLDWYGEYAGLPQSDPVGVDDGLARVVRGNKLDDDSPYLEPHTRGVYYQRAANRAGMAPGFAPQEDVTGFGRHMIGFRVARGNFPVTQPRPHVVPFVSLGVKESTKAAAVSSGPDSGVPYFRKRYLLPSPPETTVGFDEDAVPAHIRRMRVLGLHASFRGHNHSPALEVMPNGDLLMVTFTSWNEYEPGMSLMATRLRFGADQWDMPSCLVDMPDACDNTPLLCTEGDKVRLFFSNTRAIGGFPFNWIESNDSGATWSDVRFPRFTTGVGPHSRQPINTAVRDRAGNFFLPSDGLDATSVLWRSPDNLQTWQDMGGRTDGRHTTVVLLKDGSTLLGMGGKSSDIGGYMPKSISVNGGVTWEVSATPFPAYGSNQRPSVLRLRSRRLFFCGDYQRIDGAAPDTIQDRGAFVALSDDDGETWHVKKLIGTQLHETPERNLGADTIGYSVARQGADGIIHVITTMNKPCLHLAMNEAWILSGEHTPYTDDALMANSAQTVSAVRRYEEHYPTGRLMAEWHAGIGDDGRYLLHGAETWYFENGDKLYEATFERGVKTGTETLYRRTGTPEWEWYHEVGGVSRWTVFWPGGEKKSESAWRQFHADGPAKSWSPEGVLEDEYRFEWGL
jgi:formylglycine-generating enzyme required for sulfatase activity